jgi:hypothetical protein
MRDVTVWILHPRPRPDAGPLERWVAAERALIAERHRTRFLDAGATAARIVSGPPDDTPFGARLRALVRGARPRPAGVVVLGSGAVPLATMADRRAFVETAAAGTPVALANNRFSADIVAIACGDRLLGLPDLPADNALPRWLEEIGGYDVKDVRQRWRLAFDIDGPLELVLLGREPTSRAPDTARVRERMAAVATTAADRRRELLLAGRVSTATLRWLETDVAARVRALVEERGLRAASALAQAAPTGEAQRAPASVLGLLLDQDGPGALGRHVERLADAAVVDTRVLLAHRFGPDERGWPGAEDRFASDLLLPDQVGDRWLRELTESAANARIPVVLGGHSVVGPGLRLVMAPKRWT